MITESPVLNGAQAGARGAGASVPDETEPSTSDKALNFFETNPYYNYGLMGAPVVAAAIGGGIAAAGCGAAAAASAAAAAAGEALLPLAVGFAAFTAGEWLGEKATSFVMDDLGLAGALGLHKIPTDGDQPAVLNHLIAHQMANAGLWGALAGIVVAVAVSFAVVALVATTGPVGLAVLCGAAAAGGLAGGLVAGAGAALGQYGSPCGKIIEASQNVFFEGRGIARVGDKVACDKHSPPQMLAEGCKTVYANNRNIVRLGHRTTCDANVDEHVKTIYVTKQTAQVLPITDPRSKWLRWLNVITNLALAVVATKSVAGEANARTEVSCPVDAATGEFVERRDDLFLPGLLPIIFRREFANFSRAVGALGRKWANNWSIHFVLDGALSHFQAEDGCIVTFHTPDQVVLARHLKHPNLELRGNKDTEYTLYDSATQLTHVFGVRAHGRLWLSQIYDRNGNAIDFLYDSSGLRTVRRSNGDVLNVYSANWKIHRISLNGQELARYVYDERDLLIESHSFQNGSFFYSYNAKDFLDSWWDTKTTRLHYAYEGDRVVEVRSATGPLSGRLTFDDDRKVTRVVDAKGAVEFYHHDGAGLVWKRVDALGNEWLTEYDLARHITATVDPLGRRTRYAYDESGRLTRTTQPSGVSTAYSYEAGGALTGVIGPGGAAWAFERDEKGNLLRRVNPLGEVTAFRNGVHGETLRVDLPNGSFRSAYFTRELRPAAFRDARGFERRVNVDALGRLLSTTDQDGHTVHFDYSPGAGNPRGALKTTRLPDGTTLSYTYDSEGQLTSFTNGEGRVTGFRSGAFDALEEIIDARGGSLKISYDNALNITSRVTCVENQKGERYVYEYDAAGNLVRERDFGDLVTAYAYDAAGQRILVVAPDHTQTRFSYDADGRMTEAAYYPPGASEPEDRTTYSYDAAGRLVQAACRDCLVEIERDALGRVVCERVNGREVRSSYDRGALQRTTRAGDASPVKIAYDAEGFVESLAIGPHAAVRFARDRRGYETRRESSSGFLQVQDWNSVGLLTAQQAGRSASVGSPGDAYGSRQVFRRHEGTIRVYHWDRAFNPVEVGDARWGTTRYSYDARGQVVEALQESGRLGLEERFDYDATGNIALGNAIRTRLPAGGRGVEEIVEQTRFSYDPGGRVRERGRTFYVYDGAGRVTGKRVEEAGFRPKVWRFFWNAQGRLARCMTPQGETWCYGYDPFGRRLWKRRLGSANDNGLPAEAGRAYQWDGDVVAAEAPLYADGTIAWDEAVHWHHEPGSFRPLAREQGERLDYVVTDHLGTPREVFSEDGAALRWSAAFTLWGGRRAHLAGRNGRDGPERFEDDLDAEEAEAPAAAFCPIRFQGQWEDDESGLHYNRHRYYDPLAGGFIQPDPIGLNGGLNLYQYAPNPLSWVDPLGLAGDCTTEAAKVERRERYHSRSADYPKHVQATTQAAAIRMSRNGAAQYWDSANNRGGNSFRNTIEKEALANGTRVPQDGGSTYYIYDAGRPIGYNEGNETSWMRVETTDAPVPEFHGHPISPSRASGYLKGAE